MRGGSERLAIVRHLEEADRLERELERTFRRERLRSIDPRRPDMGRQGPREQRLLAEEAERHRRHAAEAAGSLRSRLERRNAEMAIQLKDMHRQKHRNDAWDIKDQIRENKADIKCLDRLLSSAELLDVSGSALS